MVHDDPNIASYIVILKSNHAWYNLSLNLFLSFLILGEISILLFGSLKNGVCLLSHVYWTHILQRVHPVCRDCSPCFVTIRSWKARWIVQNHVDKKLVFSAKFNNNINKHQAINHLQIVWTNFPYWRLFI